MAVIRVHIKDLDGFYESVRDAATATVDAVGGLDDEERDELIEGRAKKAWEALGPWVRHEEEVMLEFDTTGGTATVVRKADW